MATVFRPPTFAGNNRRPERPASTDVPNLLVTTLAVAAAIPFNTSAAAFTAPHHPAHNPRTVQADTSLGMPSTIRAQLAVKSTQTITFSAPALLRVNADTTQGMPAALRQQLLVQPVGASTQTLLLDRRAIGADTSHGTPLPLLGGAPPVPFFNPQTGASDRRGIGADTSQATPLSLLAVTPTPFFNVTQSLVQGLRVLPDTSQGTPLSLLSVQSVPFANPQAPLVERRRDVVDTSQGSPLSILALVPFSNPTQALVQRLHVLADTSQGTPRSLFPVAAPFFNPTQSAPERLRNNVDTSQGSPIALLTWIPPAPFHQTDWPAPIEYKRFQLHAWDQQANPATIPAASAVFPLPSQVLTGVVYGPNGNDYTGTLNSGGSAYLRRR